MPVDFDVKMRMGNGRFINIGPYWCKQNCANFIN